jgi:hypothetical protein
MFFDTGNKNMYDLWVEISMVFKISGHILFEGGTGPPRAVITYTPSDAPRQI